MAENSIPPRQSPVTPTDIAWVAGFMEGEGSFGYYGGIRVSAAQVQKEPITRLQAIFGGPVVRRTTKGFSGKPIWVWRPSARLGVQVMMTLYVLMSPKRQYEITSALDQWKSARNLKTPRGSTCANGHAIEGANSIIIRGHPRCRQCKNETRRLWRAKKRAAGKIYAV